MRKRRLTVLSSEAIPEPEGFWFILVDKSGDPASFGSLWKVTKDGVPLKQSELNSIRGTNYKDSSEGIIVIAGKNDDRTRVKALLLDHGTLEILKEGETEIYPGSSIWTQGNNLFMISRNGQNWSVGMYSQSLKLLQLSSLNVHPDTHMKSVFAGRTIAVVNDLSRDEQLYLYRKTAQLKKKYLSNEDVSEFRISDPDMSAYLIFMENSTRTKESFRNAVQFHDIKLNVFDPGTSSFTKQESFSDTIKMLFGYSKRSLFIMRTG
jgi:hypothetical protein